MQSEKSAAVLTIKDAQRMTPKGRKDVAEWLREQARFLVEFGTEYAPRYRSRYMDR